MNVCKVLDMTPGLEMSSWGTIHFPEEKRILEWWINVQDAQWKGTRFGSCLRAPEGGLKEIEAGHQQMLAQWSESVGHQIKMQMVCKENVSEEEIVRLILGELQKAGFPHSLEREAQMLRRRLKMCGQKSVTKPKRFQVDGK